MSAYFIVRCLYNNIDHYQDYAKAAARAVDAYKGRFLVTGNGKQTQKEKGQYPKTVIVEFESLEIAVLCYESDQYQKALSYIKYTANRDFVIAEGVDKN